MSTAQNWMRLYRAMYLKRLKEVTREQRPSLQTQGETKMVSSNTSDRKLQQHQSLLLPHLMSSGTQLMSSVLDVKGEATEASASDRETPTSAALKAPQSLAPSPHMPTR